MVITSSKMPIKNIDPSLDTKNSLNRENFLAGYFFFS